MIKSICLNIIILILSFFNPSTQDNDIIERTIQTPFYSITIPADWISLENKENDFELKERNSGQYHLYYLGGKTPFTKSNNSENTILLSIRTYHSKDETPITLEEVEKEEENQVASPMLISWEKEYIYETKNSKHFKIIKVNKEFGVKKTYYCFYLLQKTEELVHVIFLYTIKENYSPETENIIQKIFNSFTF